MAFSKDITVQQTRAVLEACAHPLGSLSSFAAWGVRSTNPAIFLPLVRSPSLTSLWLIQPSYRSVNLSTCLRQSPFTSELSIPPAMLASLTHLVVFGYHYNWFQLRQAVQHLRVSTSTTTTSSKAYLAASASLNTRNVDRSNAATPAHFASLTHFATCEWNWHTTHPLLRVAKNLKCLAVVVQRAPSRPSTHPSEVNRSDDGHVHPQAKFIEKIKRRVQGIGDPRLVVVEFEPNVENWEHEMKSSGAQGGLWDQAERLVEERTRMQRESAQ